LLIKMNINDCLKKRILRKIVPDLEKSKSSINIAVSKLDEAQKLFQSEFWNNAFLSAYTSIFHSARALLYHDGIQEKSHYAVFVYLKEKYSNLIPSSLINSFYEYQKQRHKILYGLEEMNSKEDSGEIIDDAEEFLNKIMEILNL